MKALTLSCSFSYFFWCAGRLARTPDRLMDRCLLLPLAVHFFVLSCCPTAFIGRAILRRATDRLA